MEMISAERFCTMCHEEIKFTLFKVFIDFVILSCKFYK
jgi:hypothetical protein